jgi:hypothetical protein
MKEKNTNKIIVGAVVLIFVFSFMTSQNWFNPNKLNQPFIISEITVNPLNDGSLYYGCKAPISMKDCAYYGNEYYSKRYTNLQNIGCREKTWGIECTFNGDKIL